MVKFIFKITTLFIALILVLISLVSCEDVIDVDLNSSKPRLVVEASIVWQKGTAGNEQKIKLTTTSNFFSNVIPVVSNATVYIADSSNTYTFIENASSGEYFCSNFNCVVGETYTLTVISNGQTYTATEVFQAVPALDEIEQNNQGGFLGDEIEIKFLYQDDGNQNNFYLQQINTNILFLPEYDVVSDAFFQGNQMFGLFSNEKLATGNEVKFTLHGISERYFNYMNVLLGVAGSNGGGPFTTTPATVRGNVINQSNSNNFPFGYFSLSEIDTKTYIVQ
jgi:hypothetical protein